MPQLSEGISHTDPDDLSEIIEGLSSKDVDLLIQTPSGAVDAVEKFVSVLKARLDSYRVIVPSWAKSGGTVIAISSSDILLGVNSELGPIDPQMFLPELGPVPAEFIAADDTKDPVLQKYAAATVARMKNLARKILRNGMLRDAQDDKFEEALKKLSSSTEYGSHGAVIDYGEAQELGLSVTWMPPEDRLWKLVWMLYCSYDFDTKSRGLGRIIEGAINSIARPVTVRG